MNILFPGQLKNELSAHVAYRAHLHYLNLAIHQPSAKSLTASAALALGRTHADQLMKNHLVENTNKAVSL